MAELRDSPLLGSITQEVVLLPGDEACILQGLQSYRGRPLACADPQAKLIQWQPPLPPAAAEELQDWDTPAADEATQACHATRTTRLRISRRVAWLTCCVPSCLMCMWGLLSRCLLQAEFAQLVSWWAALLGDRMVVKACSYLDRPPAIVLQVR